MKHYLAAMTLVLIASSSQLTRAQDPPAAKPVAPAAAQKGSFIPARLTVRRAVWHCASRRRPLPRLNLLVWFKFHPPAKLFAAGFSVLTQVG